MLQPTTKSATAGSWGLQFGEFVEYLSTLCEEALELACFGPYDKPISIVQ
jgi:hypothetical protein